MKHSIKECVDSSPIIDTHEHLVDESVRLAGGHPRLGCNDWSAILAHYVCDDLADAGMRADDLQQVLAEPLDPARKMALLEPFWHRVRHTGYGRAVRHAIREIYGEDDLDRRSAPRIAEQYQDLLRPGMYRRLLTDRANVVECHVNSVESRLWKRSESPDFLRQDLDITDLVSPYGIALVQKELGVQARELGEWLAVIDDVFDRLAADAVAIKCKLGYFRRLSFSACDRSRAERLFRAFTAWHVPPGEPASGEIEDFLVRYCVERAGQRGLPVKFHTGYHAGTSTLNLAHIQSNQADLSTLIADFPHVDFVLFHIGWPYQHDVLALAKSFPNVYVDMCWAWILDPMGSRRFLKEFIGVAPWHKVFTFGGDYITVEPVVGHCRIARNGIAGALQDLVDEGWLDEPEALALVDPLLRGNAKSLFG